MSYTHLTLEERKYLQQLLSEGKSMRQIAEIMERSPSTISREVRRNRSKKRPHRKSNNKYWYNHWRAQTLYVIRRRTQHRASIKPDTLEWEYVIEKLNAFWSPEQISARWSMEYPYRKPISQSTIYRYIKLGKFPNIKSKTHLRRRGKRKSSSSSTHATIKPDRLIPEWPDEIWQRERIGDWEGDTIYGGINKGSLVSLVDRKSRYVRLGYLPDRTASTTREVTASLLDGLPVHSISFDNGSEFAEFRELEKQLQTMVYFAEPHKPWQRGTNENTNDIVRFFFPKGFDFRTISQNDIQFVENLINNRPRKCLGWLTPAEYFYSQLCCT